MLARRGAVHYVGVVMIYIFLEDKLYKQFEDIEEAEKEIAAILNEWHEDNLLIIDGHQLFIGE